MIIKGAVAVITGAAGGIGRAVAIDLAKREVGGLALVDQSEGVRDVTEMVNEFTGRRVAAPYIGDVTDAGFRNTVYADVKAKFGRANICVPTAGVTRDQLAVKFDKESKRLTI